MRSLFCYAAAVASVGLTGAVLAQEAVVDNTGTVENPKPTWETQKQARTWQLGIPAPRGLITDRNGTPFAQSEVSYNLAISFPTPLDFTDEQVVNFARQQATLAKGLLGREIRINEKKILDHYKNRGVLPYDIAEDLEVNELSVVAAGVTPTLILRQSYARFYPEGQLAAHIIGYVGQKAPLSLRPIENDDLIFSESEGREGLEQIFNEELVGRPGSLHVTFDSEGRKTSERIARPPVPGFNVISTIDARIQRICEEVLEQNCERGAIVVMDPNNGEILAMASWPTFDPNIFVPYVTQEDFDVLNNDPAVPLYPRAFRSAYPPGSTFKTFVGLAALKSGKVEPASKFNCPAALSVGNFVFRNWKKKGAGSLNFVEAMTQSCNTWFYQVGIKIGSEPIIEWSTRLGLGQRTGIPLKAEGNGNIPTDEYMQRVHKRKILSGDVANMSIGQGDILITPLQMAQAMGVIANGGKFHQTRLVKQIQSLDNSVVAAYPDRVRDELPIDEDIMENLREALVEVTESGNGTARRAKVDGIHVAGKTGTAQWGPTDNQKTAAWFAGFAPSVDPQYAFAAVYEGKPGDDSIHGGTHAAPLIGKALDRVFHAKVQADDESETEPAEDDQSG
ncbi:MAG: penicillin-binding protein 2 [Chthoniobacterales bacterium]